MIDAATQHLFAEEFRYYLRQGGYLLVSVCLSSVRLSVCLCSGAQVATNLGINVREILGRTGLGTRKTIRDFLTLLNEILVDFSQPKFSLKVVLCLDHSSL